MAIRSMDKQPIEPILDEQVRAVYLCCKAIDPAGASATPTSPRAGCRRAVASRSGTGARIPSQMPKDADAARTVLLSLIDGRVERLEVLLERTWSGTKRRRGWFGFDDTKEGEQLRSYQFGDNRGSKPTSSFLKYCRETGWAAAGESHQRSGSTHATRRRRTSADSPATDPPPWMTEELPPDPQHLSR